MLRGFSGSASPSHVTRYGCSTTPPLPLTSCPLALGPWPGSASKQVYPSPPARDWWERVVRRLRVDWGRLGGESRAFSSSMCEAKAGSCSSWGPFVEEVLGRDGVGVRCLSSMLNNHAMRLFEIGVAVAVKDSIVKVPSYIAFRDQFLSSRICLLPSGISRRMSGLQLFLALLISSNNSFVLTITVPDYYAVNL